MTDDWNKEEFFSGITEDYSNYKWYKGENDNPYLNDEERPLVATWWVYERNFHFCYLDAKDTNVSIKDSYIKWINGFLNDYLPGKSANPYGDSTDWIRAFETGKK
jgi:hypothetical protein